MIITDLQGNILVDDLVTIPGNLSEPRIGYNLYNVNLVIPTTNRMYVFDRIRYTNTYSDFLFREYDLQGNHIRTMAGDSNAQLPYYLPTGILPLKNDEVMINYHYNDGDCQYHTSSLVDPYTSFSTIYTDSCNRLQGPAYIAGTSASGDIYMAYNQAGAFNSGDLRLVKFSKPNLDTEPALQEKNIHVFPNPFMEEIRISADISQPTAYIITDATGRTVRTGMLTPGQAHTLQNLSSLVAGTYFLRVYNGKTIPVTIVKMK